LKTLRALPAITWRSIALRAVAALLESGRPRAAPFRTATAFLGTAAELSSALTFLVAGVEPLPAPAFFVARPESLLFRALATALVVTFVGLRAFAFPLCFTSPFFAAVSTASVVARSLIRHG
jgi:hypothetical protein